MSYDGWVEMPDPDKAGDVVHLWDVGNYTRNVSPMWRRALTEASGGELGLGDLEGWTCAAAHPLLESACAVMRERETELREELTPPNGWGDFAGALRYLERTADATRRFRHVPDAVLRWSR